MVSGKAKYGSFTICSSKRIKNQNKYSLRQLSHSNKFNQNSSYTMHAIEFKVIVSLIYTSNKLSSQHCLSSKIAQTWHHTACPILTIPENMEYVLGSIMEVHEVSQDLSKKLRKQYFLNTTLNINLPFYDFLKSSVD